MTVKQRKEREKEQFVASVIEVAGELMREGGLANLSLRKLATGLEYSTSKLYQVFKNKHDLLLFQGEDICQRQNNRFQYIEENENPEEALLKFMHETVSFYAEEPWSAEIIVNDGMRVMLAAWKSLNTQGVSI